MNLAHQPINCRHAPAGILPCCCLAGKWHCYRYTLFILTTLKWCRCMPVSLEMELPGNCAIMCLHCQRLCSCLYTARRDFTFCCLRCHRNILLNIILKWCMPYSEASVLTWSFQETAQPNVWTVQWLCYDNVVRSWLELVQLRQQQMGISLFKIVSKQNLNLNLNFWVEKRKKTISVDGTNWNSSGSKFSLNFVQELNG